MNHPLIEQTGGILFLLSLNAATWFYLEKKTQWKLFQFIPPLLFIYILPAIFSNSGIIPGQSPLYDWMGDYLLPVFLVLLLLNVDVRATIRVMGRGVWVMLIGTMGVVLGAPVGYMAVKRWLSPEAWKGFGTLAGSWIGEPATWLQLPKGWAPLEPSSVWRLLQIMLCTWFGCQSCCNRKIWPPGSTDFRKSPRRDYRK